MKRILALTLALITLASLIGCNSSPEFKISRGTIDGNVYKNEVLGFEFTKPYSWVYSTDEDIAAAMNFAVDNLLDENFKEALENNPSVYDMMVVDPYTGANICVLYENLKRAFSSNMTEEQYVEVLKQQLEEVSAITVTFPKELYTAKLGNTEFKRCSCTATVSGTSLRQIYYLRNIGGYMASVIVSMPSGYTVAEIEAMFK